jgi:PEP-CTERM motif
MRLLVMPLTFSIAVLILSPPRPAQAGPIPIKVIVATGSYEIDVAGNRDTLTGAQLSALKVPAGASFTLSKNAAGDVVVTGVGGEPTVQRVAFNGDPNPTIIGHSQDFAGEVGYGSLVFTGLSSNTFAVGSIVEAGVFGVFTATYTTSLGDTYQTALNSLESSLDTHGIDAVLAGSTLTIYSSITNPSTDAGAFSFLVTDPNMGANVVVGTAVPEPSTIVMLGTSIFMLSVYARRRRTGLPPQEVRAVPAPD